MISKGFGKNTHTFQKLDSTNLEAERMLSENTPDEGTVILSDFQLSGKGLGKNTWESDPAENILMSIIIYPEFLMPQEQFMLNKITSLSLLRTVRGNIGKNMKVSIKWPNDVYAGENKIAGILIKNTVSGHILKSSVVGMGLNVNQETFSTGLPNPVSLFQITHRKFNRDMITRRVINNFRKYYLKLKKKEFAQINSEYLNNLLNYNVEATYRANGKIFRGMIKDVDDFGRLCIASGSRMEVFNMKEIEFVQNKNR